MAEARVLQKWKGSGGRFQSSEVSRGSLRVCSYSQETEKLSRIENQGLRTASKGGRDYGETGKNNPPVSANFEGNNNTRRRSRVRRNIFVASERKSRRKMNPTTQRTEIALFDSSKTSRVGSPGKIDQSSWNQWFYIFEFRHMRGHRDNR